MTLQTSGPISIGDLRSEYGGPTPSSLGGHYLRGGFYVKEFKDEQQTVTEGPFGDADYNVSSNGQWIWEGTVIATGNTTGTLEQGGWTYQQGSAYFTGTFVSLYRVSRSQTQMVTREINVNVPEFAGNTLNLSDYYGGEGGGYNGTNGYPITKD